MVWKWWCSFQLSHLLRNGRNQERRGARGTPELMKKRKIFPANPLASLVQMLQMRSSRLAKAGSKDIRKALLSTWWEKFLWSNVCFLASAASMDQSFRGQGKAAPWRRLLQLFVWWGHSNIFRIMVFILFITGFRRSTWCLGAQPAQSPGREGDGLQQAVDQGLRPQPPSALDEDGHADENQSKIFFQTRIILL